MEDHQFHQHRLTEEQKKWLRWFILIGIAIQMFFEIRTDPSWLALAVVVELH